MITGRANDQYFRFHLLGIGSFISGISDIDAVSFSRIFTIPTHNVKSTRNYAGTKDTSNDQDGFIVFARNLDLRKESNRDGSNLDDWPDCLEALKQEQHT